MTAPPPIAAPTRPRAILDAFILLYHLLVVAILTLLIVAALAFAIVWIGLLPLPALTAALRRRLIRVSAVCEPYLGRPLSIPAELPDPAQDPGAGGRSERGPWAALQLNGGIRLLRSPEAWRLWRWGLVESLLGIFVATMPLTLMGEGVRGIVVAPLLLALLGGKADAGEWYLWVRVVDGGSLLSAIALGCALFAIGWVSAPLWQRWHARLASAAIGGERTALRARVEQLTESRADTRRDAAAELQRIEREVHDGTQAQLATIGLRLGTADALWESDPDRARAIVEEARGDASAALVELRALMRGVHPPVLADRGLAAALEDLAISSGSTGPERVTVTTEIVLTGPFGPDVESAIYFSARELVTNALKHADARRIRITAAETPDRIQLTVLDDGRGGAQLVPWHGLSGLAGRLATFDGALSVSSPAGGPTSIRVEVPCAS